MLRCHSPGWSSISRAFSSRQASPLEGMLRYRSNLKSRGFHLGNDSVTVWLDADTLAGLDLGDLHRPDLARALLPTRDWPSATDDDLVTWGRGMGDGMFLRPAVFGAKDDRFGDAVRSGAAVTRGDDAPNHNPPPTRAATDDNTTTPFLLMRLLPLVGRIKRRPMPSESWRVRPRLSAPGPHPPVRRNWRAPRRQWSRSRTLGRHTRARSCSCRSAG